jgi:ADP-ribosylglycohydrolase
MGGDADTLAAIAGGIAHAYFGKVPEELARAALQAVPGS